MSRSQVKPTTAPAKVPTAWKDRLLPQDYE